jgi:hypothetical protein
MKIPRVYLDSSVVGGCFDEEFSGDSRSLFEMAERGEIALIISDLLAAELEQAPERVAALLREIDPEHLETVETTEEAESLRDEYLKDQVVGPTAREDALHVAIATVARADLIVSWNFKHIVHYERIRKFNAVNLRLGYTPLAIHSPTEVV